MTALGIRYLTGSAVAMNAARRRPEWPPHPGRIFMAMTAAYFETRGDPEERAALKWLEEEPAPAICASEGFDRSLVETYVPANDKHGGIVKRVRQPRSFATVRPVRDSVFLVWESDAPAAVRTGLERLCAKVTRIGHSSSLTQMWVAEENGNLKADWLPDEIGAKERMRIAERGTLDYLQQIFNAANIGEYSRLADALEIAKGKERTKLKRNIEERFPNGAPTSTRPQLSRWQGYSKRRELEQEPEVFRGPFDPKLIVLSKHEGRVLGLESTLQLTSALRNAAMKSVSDGPVPEWLSGHQADGTPTLKPHAAFFPLPFVGSRHADGHVMGLAIGIPREIEVDPPETRGTALRRALGPLLFDVRSGDERHIELWRNNVWKWVLSREKRDYPPEALRDETWTRPSRVWASVTPVVLHHYPKKGREGDVGRILREAFASALLPEPEGIIVRPTSQCDGAGHARSVPEFCDGGASLCRYQTHLTVRFAVPVEGPVLVGRGRFRGYGLFRPVTEEKRTDERTSVE